jgi:hypothetical protein
MKAFQTSTSVKREIQRLSSGLGVPESVNIATFHAEAEEGSPIGRTTTSRQTLIQGAEKAALGISALLDDDIVPIVQVFNHF